MRYLILGVTEARDEHGGAVPLGGPRLRALLTALALRVESPSAVAVEELIEEVWSGATALPGDAPAALQALVARLRRTIGRDAVRSLPGGYRLCAEPDEVDLLRFQRLAGEGERALTAGDPEHAAEVLRAALALWRGPALNDLPDRADAAARATALWSSTVQRRVAADVALGRSAEVLPELRGMARTRPLDEPLQLLLLRALRDSGRTAEALEVYEEVRSEIADRLGAAPGTELRSLHARLLTEAGPVSEGAHHGGRGAPDRPSLPAGAKERSGTSARSGTSTGSARSPGSSAPAGADAAPGDGAFPPSPFPSELPDHGETLASSPAGPDGFGRPEAGAPAGERPDRATDRVQRGNLRARLTSFVGREDELTALRSELVRSRLTTLTGTGGSGKTSLAERVAESLAEWYPDGVWMVGLAPLDHPAAVPGAALSAVGRRETARLPPAREGATAPRPGSGGHDPAPSAVQPVQSVQPVQRVPSTRPVEGSSAGFDGGRHTRTRHLPQAPAGDEATERLLEHCAHRRMLLVLDNCEHVIDAAASLAERLLAHCPGLTVLATSREPLGVLGESVRPVEPLPPQPAHRLFTERGTAAWPGFKEADDPEAVREICRRLDGLPLAIELAAARLRSLSPRQIADRLDDRFRLLTSGSRTVLPRQQTLGAVVDWSWDLLDERERAVARRLSVFSGGCTLPVAERVCSADGVPREAVLDTLGALVDKSILVADHRQSPSGSGVRYRMLETIHEYARQRAAEHPAELAAAEERHTAQLLRFVSAAEPRLRSGEQLDWLQRLEADLDNIRAALHRALRRWDRTTAIAMIRALGWFWWLRNYREEGASVVRRALELLPRRPEERDAWESSAYAELQLLAFFLVCERSVGELLRSPHHQAVARELHDHYRARGAEAVGFPGPLWPLPVFLVEELRTVCGLMDQSVANCRRWGGAWELAMALLFRAYLRVDAPGDVPFVESDIPELEELARTTGDRWLLGQIRALRADRAAALGRYDEARDGYEAAIRHAQRLGALTEVPTFTVRIAELWYRQGDSARAERLAERAETDAEHLGVVDVLLCSAHLRALIALDDGDIARARVLHDQSAEYARVGTAPPALGVAMGVLDARLTAADPDGAAAHAVRKARDALRTALERGCADRTFADAVLGAGWVALRVGDTRSAVALADAAAELRGGRAPFAVPDARTDRWIREHAAPRDPRPPDGDAPAVAATRIVERAVALLDAAVAAEPSVSS